MLIVYFVDFGVTKMVVPTPLRPFLGELFDLGTEVDLVPVKNEAKRIPQDGCITYIWP